MDGKITLKSVLLECLDIMRQELSICSKHYNGLEPKEGMEEAWDQGRRKVQALREAIPALESETVRRAMADWQKEVMEKGPCAFELEGQPVQCPICGREFYYITKEKEQQILFPEGWQDESIVAHPIEGPQGGRYEV